MMRTCSVHTDQTLSSSSMCPVVSCPVKKKKEVCDMFIFPQRAFDFESLKWTVQKSVVTSPFQTVLLNVNLNWRLLCNEQSKDDPLLPQEKLAIKVFLKNKTK